MGLIKGKQVRANSVDVNRIDWNSYTVGDLVSGVTADKSPVNKEYADSIAAGLDRKASVRVATIADLGATYAPAGGTTGSGGFTDMPADLDGITLIVGDRVLVKDQIDAKQNGIYSVTVSGALGAMERAVDHDGTPASEVSAGNSTFVEVGNTHAGDGYVLIGEGIIILNVDDIVWTQYSAAGAYLGGDGIEILSQTINVDLATNSGLNFNSGQLEILADSGINLSGTGIAVDTGYIVEQISTENLSPVGALISVYHDGTDQLFIDEDELTDITASNGLTKSGSDIALGGTLTGATVLDLNNFGFSANDAGNSLTNIFAFSNANGVQFSGNSASIDFNATGFNNMNLDASAVAFKQTAATVTQIGLSQTTTTLQSGDGTEQLEIADGSITFTSDSGGVQYAADYSGSFGLRSLVDKEYVDDQVGALVLTNGSGTTANGLAVDLGGVLSSDVQIDGGASNFNFEIGFNNNVGNFDLNNNGTTTIDSGGNITINSTGAYGTTITGDAVQLDAATGGLYLNDTGGGGLYLDSDNGGVFITDNSSSGISLRAGTGLGTSGGINIEDGNIGSIVGTGINIASYNGAGGEQSFEILPASMTILDSVNSTGLIYAADYSTNFTARSIVDKGYVDTQIGNVTLQNGEGTTFAAGSPGQVNLGGSYSSDVNINRDAAGAATIFEIEQSYTSGTSAQEYYQGLHFLGSDTGDGADSGIFLYSKSGNVSGSGAPVLGTTANDSIDAGSYLRLQDHTTSSNKKIDLGYVTTNIENSINVTGQEINMSVTNGANTTSFAIDSQNGTFSGPSGSTSGIVYNADYSGNYTARSLVDKSYVDTEISNAALNGIDDVLALGQALTATRDIDVNGNNFTISDSLATGGPLDVFELNSSGTTYMLRGANGTGTSQFFYGDPDTNGTRLALQTNLTSDGSQQEVSLQPGGRFVVSLSRPSNNASFILDADSGSSLTFENGFTIIDGAATKEGLKYASDYSADFTNRSLVDKEYVDTQISNSGLTFSNGLTESGGNVELGGTLTADTLITGSDSTDFDVRVGDTDYSFLEMDQSLMRIGWFQDAGPDTKRIDFNAASMLVYDGVSAKGLEYATDYSTNFTARSLVDKGYVDTEISNNAVSAGNGLTNNAGTFDLGGVVDSNVVFNGSGVEVFEIGATGNQEMQDISLLAGETITLENLSNTGKVELKSTMGNAVFDNVQASLNLNSASNQTINLRADGVDVSHSQFASFGIDAVTSAVVPSLDLSGLGLGTRDALVGGGEIVVGLNDTSTFTVVTSDENKKATLIGTRNSAIQENLSNTVVIGGQNIVASESNMVYVPALDVESTIKSSNTLLLDAEGNLSSRSDNGTSTTISEIVLTPDNNNTIIRKGDGTNYGGAQFNTDQSTMIVSDSSQISSIRIQGSDMTVTDNINNEGLRYAGDYSANNTSNDRWIVDKGYVDSAIAAGATGGIDDVLSSSQDLTANRAIITDGNQFSIIQENPAAGFGAFISHPDSTTVYYSRGANNSARIEARESDPFANPAYLMGEIELEATGEHPSADGDYFVARVGVEPTNGVTLTAGSQGSGGQTNSISLASDNADTTVFFMNVEHDWKFQDGRTGTQANGILLTGYGETSDTDASGANYANLVGTSLVPKKYVDDAIIAGATGGIDDVLALDQALTGTRKIDAGANKFDIVAASSGGTLNFGWDDGGFTVAQNTTIAGANLSIFGTTLNNGGINITGSTFNINSSELFTLEARGSATARVVFDDSNRSTSKFGFQYVGFGETDVDTEGAVDYSSLVFNSLVPKKYVDDAVSAGVGSANLQNILDNGSTADLSSGSFAVTFDSGLDSTLELTDTSGRFDAGTFEGAGFDFNTNATQNLNTARMFTSGNAADFDRTLSVTAGVGLKYNENSTDVFTATGSGISYAADYSTANAANDRWLVDKAYVDAAVTGGVTASNGLTEVGGDIRLGGALTANTTISDTTAEDLTITLGGSLDLHSHTSGNVTLAQYGTGTMNIVNQGTGGNMTVQQTSGGTLGIDATGGGQFDVTQSGDAIFNIQHLGNEAFNITHEGNGASAEFNIINNSDGGLNITNNVGALTITDTPGVGMQYAADYSTGFVTRSLVDKGYVDTEISNSAITNGKGTTANGTAVDLGGSITVGDDVEFIPTGTSTPSTGTVFNFGNDVDTQRIEGVNINMEFDVASPENFKSKASFHAAGSVIEHRLDNVNDYTFNRLSFSTSGILLVGNNSNLERTANIQTEHGGAVNLTSQNTNLVESLKLVLDYDNGITFTDDRSVGAAGAEYAADYSTGYTNRSLVDKEYVDTAVSNGVGSATLQNVLDNGSTATINSTFGVTLDDTVDQTVELDLQSDGVSRLIGSNTSGAGVESGFTFSNLASPVASMIYNDTSSAAQKQFLVNSGSAAIQVTNNASATNLFQMTESATTFTDAINSTGIVYAADYSTNFTTRSLVDKGYVDTEISNNAVVAGEGITNNAGTFDLGGTFASNIDISSTNGSNFEIGTESSVGDNSTELNITPAAVTMRWVDTADSSKGEYVANSLFTEMRDQDGPTGSYGRVSLSGDSYSRFEFNDGSDEMSLVFTDASMLIIDSINDKGLEYSVDYSTNFTARSLVDKEYVDTAISNSAVNGIDDVLAFNQTLTAARAIDASTFGLTLSAEAVATNLPVNEALISIEGVSTQFSSVIGFNAAGMINNIDDSNQTLTSKSGILDIGGDVDLGITAFYDAATPANSTLTITDDAASTGVVYGADYSTNFTARSIIDKGFIQSDNFGASKYAAVFYVDPTGNDGTAERNNPSAPYLTINAAADAARTVAVASGTKTFVYVRFGTYNESEIVRDQVDMYFEDRSVVYHTTASILTDAHTSFTSNGEFNIYGLGSFANLNVDHANDLNAVNLSKSTTAYIEAKDLGDVHTHGTNGASFLTIENATVRFHNIIINSGTDKNITFKNCTLLSPIKLDGFGDNETTAVTYENCKLRLLADYSFATKVAELWTITDSYNSTTIDYIDPAISGNNLFSAEQTGYATSDAMLAAYVPQDLFPTYSAIIEGNIVGATYGVQTTLTNCQLIIERDYTSAVILLQQVATTNGSLIFEGCTIVDNSVNNDTVGFVANKSGVVTTDMKYTLGNVMADVTTLRKDFSTFERLESTYQAVDPRIGGIQLDDSVLNAGSGDDKKKLSYNESSGKFELTQAEFPVETTIEFDANSIIGPDTDSELTGFATETVAVDWTNLSGPVRVYLNGVSYRTGAVTSAKVPFWFSDAVAGTKSNVPTATLNKLFVSVDDLGFDLDTDDYFDVEFEIKELI